MARPRHDDRRRAEQRNDIEPIFIGLRRQPSEDDVEIARPEPVEELLSRGDFKSHPHRRKPVGDARRQGWKELAGEGDGGADAEVPRFDPGQQGDIPLQHLGLFDEPLGARHDQLTGRRRPRALWRAFEDAQAQLIFKPCDVLR